MTTIGRAHSQANENARLDRLDGFFRRHMPSMLTGADLRLLEQVGVPTAISLRNRGIAREWLLLATDGQLKVLQEGSADPACRFRMEASVFEEIVAAKRSAQMAFFTGRLSIEGNRLLALKLGSLLESIFRRSPVRLSDLDGGDTRREALAPASASHESRDSEPLTAHQRRVLRLHLDPDSGTPFWIERAAALGVTANDLRTTADLIMFGPFDRNEAAARPWRDLVPRSLLSTTTGWILGETGGTTGAPLTAAWTPADFERAFVRPLASLLEGQGRPALRQWLFVGPTGPHIIGRAADALAHKTTGLDALRVDFDPRYHRRLAPGSPAADRHLSHIAKQAEWLLRRELVDALFITPSLLRRLLDADDAPSWRERLRLVHLGGQSVSEEDMVALRNILPVSTRLINGYGNSLFGCLVEEQIASPLRYRPHAERLRIRLLADASPSAATVADGEWGRVCFDRFDESMLLINVVERDEAWREGHAIVAPRPAASGQPVAHGSLY